MENDAFLAFKNLLEISNQLEVAIDKALRDDDLTARQFKLLAVVDKAFNHPPSIKEVAEALSTSHQNVKQMADQLARRGYLRITRDANDKRVLRLETTRKNARFWASKQAEHEEIMIHVFNSLSSDEIKELNRLLLLLSKGLSDFVRD